MPRAGLAGGGAQTKGDPQLPQEAGDTKLSRYARKPQAVEIRDATENDASEASQVLRRSIERLCVADHGHDPGILAQWLANKTPEMFCAWLHQPGKLRAGRGR